MPEQARAEDAVAPLVSNQPAEAVESSAGESLPAEWARPRLEAREDALAAERHLSERALAGVLSSAEQVGARQVHRRAVAPMSGRRAKAADGRAPPRAAEEADAAALVLRRVDGSAN